MLRWILAGALVCAACTTTTSSHKAAPDPLAYPESPRGEHQDTYHGETVADPYRWLEDNEADRTKQWVAAQNEVTNSYLQDIRARPAVKARLKALWNYERYGVPEERGGVLFFTKNDGLQNQSVLYKQAKNETPQILIDPNSLSDDGTTALKRWVPSPNGKWLAYGISEAGSDWITWRVRDVATGKDTDDVLRWTKFTGAAWLKDESGFFYSRYAPQKEGDKLKAVTEHNKLYFHRLGDTQDRDRLVLERPDHPTWGFSPAVTSDGKYLVVTVWQGTDDRYQIYVQDLATPKAPMVTLVDKFEAGYTLVGNVGPSLYFKTTLNAKRGRVVAVDVTSTPYRFEEVLPESTDTLKSVSRVGDHLVSVWLKDAHSVVRVSDMAGRGKTEIELPGLGSVWGFDGEPESDTTHFAFSSFTTPTAIYRLDAESLRVTPWQQPKVAFNPADYETKQVFYTSKDGTRVPMFVSHKKGLDKAGDAPTLLYGYGGFNISITPWFKVPPLVWMEMGGIYAVANLRGGGEYGESWHKAGTKTQKQNVFDDFIAGAEWLIDEGYTRPDRLAIQGRSNGGLLVGAAMAQRPDLFGAALPAVGVMDMLRFHKFTIGWAWVDDYGSSDNPEEFKALRKYSPLHNLKPGTRYPATMVTTADHDDRVVPAHSFKFAAALQHAHAGPAPTLIRIETKAGHGAGTPTEKRIEEAADTWSFLLKNLEMTLPESYVAQAP